MKEAERGMCCALPGCAVNSGTNYKIPSLWLKAYNLDKEIEHRRLTGDQIREFICLSLIPKGTGIHWRIKGVTRDEKNKQKSRQKVPWTHCVDQKEGVHWNKGATLHHVVAQVVWLWEPHNRRRSLRSIVNWGPHLWVPFLFFFFLKKPVFCFLFSKMPDPISPKGPQGGLMR